MVVGTPSSFKVLGQQLLAAAESDSNSATASWPTQVANPDIVGPYTDIPDFKLSFHLQGSSPLESILPIGRRSMPGLLIFAVAAFAFIGTVAIVRWIL